MEYECHLADINQLSVGLSGIQEPLCNDCQTPDCSNPIEEKCVYVVGIPHKMRLWTLGGVVKQVVSCSGYIGANDVAKKSGKNNETKTND